MSWASNDAQCLRQGLARSARLLRTVRYLKPVQIYGRVLARMPVRQPQPRATSPLRQLTAPWVAAIERPRRLLGRSQVRLLNETGEIAEGGQWNDAGKSKLWLYNLHYFDDLAAEATPDHEALQRELVGRWIAENPIGSGNGWEPYPISLRVVNWIKWALAGHPLEASWRGSLAQQVRWLERRIEWHLLGNHLFANAKALVLAGLYFDGPEAQSWLERGASILARELGEQILGDGGHFERSPMYHAIILEDVLDLYNAALAFGVLERRPFDRLAGIIQRMRAWLQAMSHPDGGVAFFNDSALGIAPACAALEAYATRLGLPPVTRPAGACELRASGYVRLDRGPATLIADIGEIGPSYLPGHAHADTLSFELSLGSERIVVNAGTSAYAIGALRAYQRSTAAHSTVEIDGSDSSEVWSSFRVGRRARVSAIAIAEEGETAHVAAQHDGYRYLKGRPVHRRSWQLDDEKLVVVDQVTGGWPHASLARFHLGPGTEATISVSGQDGALRTPAGRSIVWRTSERATLVAGNWYPEFGTELPNTCLVVPVTQNSRTELAWPK